MDTLDKRLDANVSASTDKDKDYAAEVVDARVDEEGTKYGSVGSHIRAIGSGKGILKGAVNGSRLSFLDITPELVWTADKYISRKYGGLDNFSQGSNVYFATLDYIPFPYGGCWLQVYSAMSTVESDKSGIAFYDQQGRSTPLLCEEPSCGYHRPCDLGQSADHAVREAEGRHDERPRQEKGKEH